VRALRVPLNTGIARESFGERLTSRVPVVRVEKATVGSDATACLCLGGVARAIMPQQIDQEKRQEA